ncbi:hypothetical protein P5673_014224 [Acropora cervicornis]|uniref:THAP-type domain-containing protein n=1 Tax=Acropora cervicornis TaxID=6130 RepID=A0AAD9V601_ACRCE|nr:hypothetical protein P5673_014224 [Acropora cervicornis]
MAFRRKWRKFCRPADKGFETQENPRICGAHFKISDFKQSLNGRIDVRKGTSPSIFKVAECKENNSPRDRRSEKRKRPEHMEDCTYQPLKEARITQLKVYFDTGSTEVGTVNKSSFGFIWNFYSFCQQDDIVVWLFSKDLEEEFVQPLTSGVCLKFFFVILLNFSEKNIKLSFGSITLICLELAAL